MLGPCQGSRKNVEIESQSNNNWSWRTKNGPQGPEEETGRIRNQWENRNKLNNSIAEIC